MLRSSTQRSGIPEAAKSNAPTDFRMKRPPGSQLSSGRNAVVPNSIAFPDLDVASNNMPRHVAKTSRADVMLLWT